MGRAPDSTNQQARAGACAHVTRVRPEEVRLIGDAQNLVYFNNVTCARACVGGRATAQSACSARIRTTPLLLHISRVCS